MSDDHDPTFGPSDDPAFDDPAYDDLRALLADARATGPVPADVAARLDATLAALQEERRAETVVVPLRRRRTAARVLVAAAAVVVVASGGVGIAQLAQRNSSGSMHSTAADALRSESGDAAASAPPSSGALSGTPSAVPPVKSQLGTPRDVALPAFSSARFAEQVAAFDPATRQFAAEAGQDAATAPPTSAAAPTTTRGRTASTCPGPSLPDTTSVPILFDGDPAVLVLHETTGGTQEIDAWSCDGSAELASATVAR